MFLASLAALGYSRREFQLVAAVYNLGGCSKTEAQAVPVEVSPSEGPATANEPVIIGESCTASTMFPDAVPVAWDLLNN